MFKSFLYKVKVFFSWLPIIMSDRQWDYFYFYVILKHKLTLMHDFFNNDLAYSCKAKHEAKTIKKCILLLERLLSDDYDKLCGSDMLDKKWGEPGFEHYPVQGKPGFNILNIKRKGIVSPKDERLFAKELLMYDKKSVALEKQDKEYLFKLLTKHLNSWWD